MGFTGLSIHQESWPEGRVDRQMKNQLQHPSRQHLVVWDIVLQDVVYELNQQPTYSDTFIAILALRHGCGNGMCHY